MGRTGRRRLTKCLQKRLHVHRYLDLQLQCRELSIGKSVERILSGEGGGGGGGASVKNCVLERVM